MSTPYVDFPNVRRLPRGQGRGHGPARDAHDGDLEDKRTRERRSAGALCLCGTVCCRCGLPQMRPGIRIDHAPDSPDQPRAMGVGVGDSHEAPRAGARRRSCERYSQPTNYSRVGRCQPLCWFWSARARVAATTGWMFPIMDCVSRLRPKTPAPMYSRIPSCGASWKPQAQEPTPVDSGPRDNRVSGLGAPPKT